jgi:hypothetical protein
MWDTFIRGLDWSEGRWKLLGPAHFRPPSPWASACTSDHLPRRQSLPTQRSQLGRLGQIVLLWNATTPATRRSDEDGTTGPLAALRLAGTTGPAPRIARTRTRDRLGRPSRSGGLPVQRPATMSSWRATTPIKAVRITVPSRLARRCTCRFDLGPQESCFPRAEPLAVVSWLARDDARYDQFIGAISALAA